MLLTLADCEAVVRFPNIPEWSCDLEDIERARYQAPAYERGESSETVEEAEPIDMSQAIRFFQMMGL